MGDCMGVCMDGKVLWVCKKKWLRDMAFWCLPVHWLLFAPLRHSQGSQLKLTSKLLDFFTELFIRLDYKEGLNQRCKNFNRELWNLSKSGTPFMFLFFVQVFYKTITVRNFIQLAICSLTQITRENWFYIWRLIKI